MSGPRRILLTRPAEDAAPLARRLESMGHRALLEPLLVIHYLDDIKVDLAGVQALAFTSANSVRALAHARPDAYRLGIAVFAVGSATAAAARDAGFGLVVAADGNVDSLARTIAQTARPDAGVVLHIAGRERAGDLAGSLSSAGFTPLRLVLYGADGADVLSAPTVAALSAGDVDDVMIFSPRTARQFVTLIRRAGLVREAARLRLLALSPNVAEAARDIDFAAVAVAAQPDQDAVLALLDAAADRER